LIDSILMISLPHAVELRVRTAEGRQHRQIQRPSLNG
jgi:hypothetical protein